jgi:hypothetical protein
MEEIQSREAGEISIQGDEAGSAGESEGGEIGIRP